MNEQLTENKILSELFDKFKDENDTISNVSAKRIINILKLDISKLEYKTDYTFDDFIMQVTILLPTYKAPIKQLTKNKLNAEIKKKLNIDSGSVDYIIDEIFNDNDNLNLDEITFNLI